MDVNFAFLQFLMEKQFNLFDEMVRLILYIFMKVDNPSTKANVVLRHFKLSWAKLKEAI